MRYLFYLCAGILSAGVHGQTCTSQIGQCSYYQCKEQVLQCGEQGYLIDFGLKYCDRYLDAEKYFSPAGQVWLNQVRICLQQKLDTPADYTCANLENYAVGTHYDCYMDAGYCALPALDKWLVSFVGAELLTNPHVVVLVARLDAACEQPPILTFADSSK